MATKTPEISGARWLGSDRLGAWLVHSFIRRWAGGSSSPQLALGWREDTIHYFWSGDGRVGLWWEIQWASVDEAATFESEVRAWEPDGSSWRIRSKERRTVLVVAQEDGTLLESLWDWHGVEGETTERPARSRSGDRTHIQRPVPSSLMACSL